MDYTEAQIQRTWVQLLVDHDLKEAAAIAIDTDIELVWEGWQDYRDEDGAAFRASTFIAQLHVPTQVFGLVKRNEQIRKIFEEALNRILEYRTITINRNRYYHDTLPEYESQKIEVLQFEYAVKLLDIEEDWKDAVRELITSSSGVRNQASTTELMFAKDMKEPISYNGLKYASQSEVRIAQELERRKVLFFPLAVGVRADTGSRYKDHREIDFLICDNGVWGVLEVSYHPNRFEKDAEKDGWWKQSGILCVEHRTAENCYNKPKEVVDGFLKILAQHKR